MDQFGLGNREVDFPGMSNCPDGAWRERALVRYEEEEVVRAKSSTYERTKPWGREICKGET